MGRTSLQDTLNYTKKEQALKWHLQANHFPPVSSDFLPAARKAIKEGNKGNWSKEIKMPNGVIKKVSEIIEGLHLDEFLDNQEED
jgi:hypothetical protein